MKHLFALLFLLALSAPVTAHHTKEHVLQPSPVVTSPTTAEENGSQLWCALGPFFLLAALGVVRWELKHRAAQRARQV